MFRKLVAVLLADLAVLAIPGAVSAQEGAYVGMVLGPAITPGMVVAGTNNDWSTRCDLITNPTQAETGGGCTEPPSRPTWSNEVAGGSGILPALAFGYRWAGWRIEGEYFYRSTTYDDLSQTRIGADAVLLAKADQEIEIADGGVDDLLAHNVFANLYYDFTSGSRFTPYLGLGAGAARVSLDYFSRWTRNDNPSEIDTFVDPLLQARISGTTTIGRAKLSDLLTGVQALAGVDYRVSDAFSLGVKVRWTRLGEFEDGDEWVQLRSHESSVGRDFPIRYTATTSDTSSFAIGLDMKYRFN